MLLWAQRTACTVLCTAAGSITVARRRAHAPRRAARTAAELPSTHTQSHDNHSITHIQGTKHQLRGCVNDCLNIRGVLEEFYGFAPENIHTLLESDPGNGLPTGANIKRKLSELVAESQPGDTLVFTYSGHGTQVGRCRRRRRGGSGRGCVCARSAAGVFAARTHTPSSTPPPSLSPFPSAASCQVPCGLKGEEADRKDEALCPTDLNVITDDDLRRILKVMVTRGRGAGICCCMPAVGAANCAQDAPHHIRSRFWRSL